MMKLSWLIAGLLGAALVHVPHADATVVNIPTAQDATLFGGASYVDRSSSGPGLFVGTDAMRLPKRGLISFDVASYVPAGATITDVALTLYLGQVAGAANATTPGPGAPLETIRLYEVTTPWRGGTNGTSGYPGPGFNGSGQGFVPNSGDVTWAHSSYSSAAWNTAGGDFATTQSAALAVGETIGAAYSWTSTAALIADVQGWLDGATPNDGLLLKNDDESGQYSYRAFYTREGATEQGVPQNAPVLTVSYTQIPEPPALALLAVGTFLTVFTKRKLNQG